MPDEPSPARPRVARPARIDFAALSLTELRAMSEAGREIRECYRALAKTGDNIIGEVLRDQSVFREWNHYPENDVTDPVTHAQFYYHAHPVGGRPWAEHGHFHTFLHSRGMPAAVRPAEVPPQADLSDPAGGEVAETGGSPGLTHLVAISMNPTGLPTRLFTTNRWVTGETWYGAADVCAMLDYFVIDHTRPSWALNRWISAMFRLFKPQIIELVRARDRPIAGWRPNKSGTASVYDDRSLEVTSTVQIDIDRQIQKIDIALARLG